MKKLLLSLGLTAVFFANAQENWVFSEDNGFMKQAIFRFSQPFQNKLYVALDSSSHIMLFSSATGNYGSYTRDTGITHVLLGLKETMLTSFAANANYMFLGSQTTYDTTGGVQGVIPQVYRFDGTTYTKHGTINVASLPPANQLHSLTYYNSISKLALYSPTGSNDTVYAFLSPDSPGNISVWKAPANQLNPTWVNSTNFPASSGINKVYGTKVWHKKLYISVGNATNGGMILRTSNGVSWDTVTTALSMSATLGVNSFNDLFTSLEVYNDTLIASVINNAKIPLVYTADSLATLQTWKACFDSAHAASIISNWAGINNMVVADGKLWIQATQQSTLAPMVFMIHKNRFNRDTLIRTSYSNGLESASNAGQSFTLTQFNNAVYATGHLAPALLQKNAKGGSNDPAGTFMYAGIIYRFTTVNPTPSFIDTVSTGTGFCANNTIYFSSTSTNASSYAWYIHDSLYSTQQSFTYYSPVAVTDTVKLVAYNGTNQSLYKDSITHIVKIYGNGSIVSVSASSYTVCQGQPDTLKAHITGGTPPYTYTWHNSQDNIDYHGDTTTVITLYTVPTFSPYIYMYLNAHDVHMCPANGNGTQYIYVNKADSLSGIVSDTSNNPVTAASIYLFKKKMNHVGLADSSGVTGVSVSGKYFFPGLYYGDYYVKAVADTSLAAYKTAVGTYYSSKPNAFQWDSALVINQHTCTGGNNSGKNIKIIQIPPASVSGPGTITGVVSKGPGYGARYAGGYAPMGAPLKGVDIKLGKNPGGNAAARTTSDNTGHYSFANVPLGSYKIYVDIPNYGMDSVRAVVLDTVHKLSVHNDYYVDSTMVRVVPTYSATAAICTGDSIRLGGAYQHNAGAYY
ncbi:MAG TPA: carboxypeptidase-like regulatory domain-containing protein, partial [Bacteroidia bacterium]|nr:carboxypeptidase-like regulatory domain-containing protein [Bacteroidia bacterium]